MTAHITPGSVFVGIPHGGNVKYELMASLLRTFVADKDARKMLGGIVHAASPYLVQNANLVAAQFLSIPQAEWLWSLEWDHAVTPDTLYKLADAEKLIISALYFIEMKGLVLPCASKAADYFHPIDSFNDTEVLKVESVGMGCTLIHRSVLERMVEKPDANVKRPWYWYDCDPSKDDKGKPIVMGHDLTFCQRAKRAGFESWLHPGVQVPHLDKGRTLNIEVFAAQPFIAKTETTEVVSIPPTP